jgi:hypothetical protein
VTALVIGLALAVLLLAVLVAGLLRSHAEILRSLHELGAGREDTGPNGPTDVPFTTRPGVVQPGGAMTGAAYDVAGVAPGEEASLLNVVSSGSDTLLAFLSSGCLTCNTFWDTFRSDNDLGLPPGTRLVVLTKGSDMESESAVRGLAPERHPVVMSTQAWVDYGVPGSPYFVLVDGVAGRVVGEGSATAWEQVVRLVGEAASDRVMQLQRPSAEDRGDGAHREARADRELLAAGIVPGHESLYQSPVQLPPQGRD